MLFFLEDFARWNPSQEPSDHKAELMRTLVQACRKHPMSSEIVAGSKVDQAVNAIWAAMVYHTPALNQALKAYGNASWESSVTLRGNRLGFLPSTCLICRSSLFLPTVNQDCKSFLCEEFVQVYLLADSIRTWMVRKTPRIYVCSRSTRLISLY